MPILKREVDLLHPPTRDEKPADLVFVSAGLGLDGGGRADGRAAAGGRLRGLRPGAGPRLCSLLTLARRRPDRGDGAGRRDFDGDARALALEVWRRQLERPAGGLRLRSPGAGADRRPSCRARLRAPYLIPLYGIEVWRPLGWDRRRALARATAGFAISAHTLERARPFCPRASRAPARGPPGAGGAAGRRGRWTPRCSAGSAAASC